ncbi:hypothetical protein Pint_26454 [Pistacia integerrima]|uniref:Uncharacterized protein n=1 Tax=Pistacia integerrima TaxID=434235 RepID=A0ACC0YDD0_9ROSI|nr:hypothetical protein Pint_26454 [Pistacia integerrima]
MLDALLVVGKTLNAYSLLFEIRAKGGAIDWKSCEDLIASLKREGNTKQANILSRMIRGGETDRGSKKGKKQLGVPRLVFRLQKSSSISFPHSPSLPGFAIGIEVAFERKDRFSVVETAAVRELTGSLTRSEGLRFALIVWVPGSFEIGIVAERLGKS